MRRVFGALWSRCEGSLGFLWSRCKGSLGFRGVNAKGLWGCGVNAKVFGVLKSRHDPKAIQTERIMLSIAYMPFAPT